MNLSQSNLIWTSNVWQPCNSLVCSMRFVHIYTHVCACVCQRIGHAACHSNAQATCAVSPNELNNLTLEMIIKWKIIAQCTHSLSHCTVAFMIMTFGNWRCGSNVSATAEYTWKICHSALCDCIEMKLEWVCPLGKNKNKTQTHTKSTYVWCQMNIVAQMTHIFTERVREKRTTKQDKANVLSSFNWKLKRMLISNAVEKTICCYNWLHSNWVLQQDGFCQISVRKLRFRCEKTFELVI